MTALAIDVAALLSGDSYPGTLYLIVLRQSQRRPAIVVIAEKHRLAMAPSLGDVVRGPLHHGSTQRRH